MRSALRLSLFQEIARPTRPFLACSGFAQDALGFAASEIPAATAFVITNGHFFEPRRQSHVHAGGSAKGHEPSLRFDDCEVWNGWLVEVRRMSAIGVRRDKAALSSGCKPHPAIRSRRKQSEQSWR